MANNFDQSLTEVWASRVVSFSSQYNSSGWAADQILGQPRVYPSYGDHQGAWAQSTCSANEFIELEFPKKMFVKGLDIYETLNAGAITKIQLKTPSAQWVTVYENSPQQIQSSRIFQPNLGEVNFETNQIRIEMDCTAAQSWCELDAVKMKGTLTNLASPPPLTSLADDLRTLVDNQEFSDIRINVGTRTFYGHRAILTARCEYFRAMLRSDRGNWNEGQRQVIDIPNISENAFLGVLQYIYTHGIDKDITPASLVELIRVADRFSLDGLMKLCAIYLHERMAVDNVVGIYREATETLPVLEDIKQECIRFITAHMESVSRREEFTKLPQEVMLEIIQASASQLSIGK